MIRTAGPGATEINPGHVPDAGERFLNSIGDDTYPCVGARMALFRGSIETHEFGELGDCDNDQPMLDSLSRFVVMIEASAWDDDTVHSYAALFHGPFGMSELRFESLMWAQLWQIHKLDVQTGNLPAEDVSSDAGSPHFSLSLAGHPFFLIGLHPRASRIARQFSQPVLVFNSHRQFEKLREGGRFEEMQAATRLRDIELQGSLNPNLADFGEMSEARQYSGREVAKGWQCPYDFKKKL